MVVDASCHFQQCSNGTEPSSVVSLFRIVPLAFQSLNFNTVLNWEASNSAASWQSDSSRRLFWHWFRTPNFPTSITDTTRLGDLITTDSSFIKNRHLGMDTEFLNEYVDNWPGQPSFYCFQYCEQLCIAWCKTEWQRWSPWGHGFSLEAPRGQLVMSLALASEVKSSPSMLCHLLLCKVCSYWHWMGR